MKNKINLMNCDYKTIFEIKTIIIEQIIGKANWLFYVNKDVKIIQNLISENNNKYKEESSNNSNLNQNEINDNINANLEKIKNLEIQKEKIKNNFGFAKKRRINTIDLKIEEAKSNYKVLLDLLEKQKKSQIKFIDTDKMLKTNKEYQAKLDEIKQNILENTVKNCFKNNPNLFDYDFNSTPFDSKIKKAIESVQNNSSNNEQKLDKTENNNNQLLM